MTFPGQKAKGAIFDTQVFSKESFAPSVFLAGEQGLELEYVGIDKIVDLPIDSLFKKAENIAFFKISSEFLRGFQTNSENEVYQKFSRLLKTVGQNFQTTVVFMLPPLGRDSQKALEIIEPLLTISGMQKPFQSQDFNKIEELKAFLSNPLEARKVGFHTSLVPPSAKNQKVEQVKNFTNSFPSNRPNISSLIDVFLPMAFNLYFEQRKIVLSSNSLFGLVSPTENFGLLPLQEYLVDDLIVLISQFFLDIKNFALGVTDPELVLRPRIPKFVQLFEKLEFCDQTRKIKMPTESAISKVSWMEIDDFCVFDGVCQNDLCTKQINGQKLIDRTLDSGLDWVWINLSPNTFLPKNSINNSRSCALMKGLEKFAQLLAQCAQERGVKIPKFLLGLELGNNIVEQNSPKNCATDIYGNQYCDIPAPLDFNFWKDELLKPLKMFLDEWQNFEISKLFPVSGIVLDIEFYNRKWTGMFLPTMGFDKFNRESFSSSIGQKKASKLPIQTFIKKMVEAGNCEQYFKFLELRASELSGRLMVQLEKLLGKSPVCVYVPNIVFDWFFTGFFAGLSARRPIHIFSFNSRFDLIGKLMETKKISASHGAAVMLSKVSMHEDFDLVEKLFRQNIKSNNSLQSGGIWLNRFSRIGQPFQPGQWFFLEQSPATEARRERFCRFLSRLN